MKLNIWPDHETNDDLLGFSYLAETVCELIVQEDFLPATIGIFGDWGSGKSSILQMIGQPELIEDSAGGGSDKYYEIVNIDIPIDRITINKLEKEKVNKSGGFFPYINTSDIDLARL